MGRGLLRQAQADAPGGAVPRFFPLGLDHSEQLVEIVAGLAARRTEAGRDTTEPYDVVVALPPGDDPAPRDAISIDQLHAVIRDGPVAPA